MPDSAEYKRTIAKVILFRKAQSIARSQFTAFHGNIAVYTIALFANRLGDRLDFERIWTKQDVSPELKEQLRIWSMEVNTVLQQSASGRMISEWAKKPECWEAVRSASYSTPLEIPEVA